MPAIINESTEFSDIMDTCDDCGHTNYGLYLCDATEEPVLFFCKDCCITYDQHRARIDHMLGQS